MVAFYRALGFDVAEHEYFVSVYVGDQMINLHRRRRGSARASRSARPAARPPCGDLCFVWEGSPDALHAHASPEIGADVEEGPVERHGGRRADRHERVRARPRRQPRRVHELPVNEKEGRVDGG